MEMPVYGFAASQPIMLPEQALVCSALIFLEEKGVVRFHKMVRPPYGNRFGGNIVRYWSALLAAWLIGWLRLARDFPIGWPPRGRAISLQGTKSERRASACFS